MKFIEKILAVASLLGWFLVESFSLPSALVVYPLLALATFYYVFSFSIFNNIPGNRIFHRHAYKATSWSHIGGAVITGVGLANICIGMVFRILSYAGGTNLLEVGIGLCFVIAIIAIYRFNKRREDFYMRIFQRVGIIGVIGVVMI